MNIYGQRYFEKIMKYVIDHSAWHTSEIHGLNHWRKVERNGLFLAEQMGIDTDLIRLFAIFHDSMRQTDNHDSSHGPRAAKFIESINDDLLNLSRADLGMLMHACKHHTDTRQSATPFAACCWDADRLDIGRVGECIDTDYLSTLCAKTLVDRDILYLLDEYEYESVIK